MTRPPTPASLARREAILDYLRTVGGWRTHEAITAAVARTGHADGVSLKADVQRALRQLLAADAVERAPVGGMPARRGVTPLTYGYRAR